LPQTLEETIALHKQCLTQTNELMATQNNVAPVAASAAAVGAASAAGAVGAAVDGAAGAGAVVDDAVDVDDVVVPRNPDGTIKYQDGTWGDALEWLITCMPGLKGLSVRQCHKLFILSPCDTPTYLFLLFAFTFIALPLQHSGPK
jgi:hypothetical protein